MKVLTVMVISTGVLASAILLITVKTESGLIVRVLIPRMGGAHRRLTVAIGLIVRALMRRMVIVSSALMAMLIARVLMTMLKRANVHSVRMVGNVLIVPVSMPKVVIVRNVLASIRMRNVVSVLMAIVRSVRVSIRTRLASRVVSYNALMAMREIVRNVLVSIRMLVVATIVEETMHTAVHNAHVRLTTIRMPSIVRRNRLNTRSSLSIPMNLFV